jgi:hypothetical protein
MYWGFGKRCWPKAEDAGILLAGCKNGGTGTSRRSIVVALTPVGSEPVPFFNGLLTVQGWHSIDPNSIHRE